MISRLKRGLRKYDLFGVCLNFNIQKQKQYQSVFGGMMSTAMSCILLYIFIAGLINILLRNQFQIDSQQQQNMNPDYSEINITNFFFAIKLDNPFQSLYSTNKSAYNIVMNQMVIKTFQNGTTTKYSDYQYSLVQCQAEHLKYINNQGQDQIKNNIGNYLCLPLNYSLKLQGTFNSEVFYYPALKVSVCQTQDCYSQDEIAVLANNRSFMVSLSTLIQSSIYIKDSQENKIMQTLNSDFFLQTNLLEESKADLFLQNNRVNISNNLLSFYKQQESKNFWSFSIFNVRQFTQYHSTASTIFSVNLRISQDYEETKKTVRTFDDFLSYFGGLLKVISSIFGIIALKYNELGLRISLANHLYQFNIPKKQGGKYQFSYDSLLVFIESQVNRVTELQGKLKNHAKSILKTSKYMKAWVSQKFTHPNPFQNSQNDLINEQQIDQYQYDKYVEQLQEYKQDFLQKLINQLSQIKRELKLGFNFFIYELLCCTCCEKVQQTRKILKQSENMILKDLDIINLLQKIQEIDKLKRVLLEEDQIIVFNYSPKPVVYIIPSEAQQETEQNKEAGQLISQFKEQQKRQATLRQKKPFTKPKKLFEIYQSYQKLKDQKSHKNQKIIGLLGPTIELIFQKYYEIQKMAQQFELPIASVKTIRTIKSENQTIRTSTLYLFQKQNSPCSKIQPKTLRDDGSDVEA